MSAAAASTAINLTKERVCHSAVAVDLMLVFVPMVPERPQAALLCSYRSFEFVIQPLHPWLVLPCHGDSLLLAYLGDVVQMSLDFIEQTLTLFAFARHPTQYPTKLLEISRCANLTLCESDQ
jgi:hypothetical protein